MHYHGLRGQSEVVFPDSETFSPSTRLLLLWGQPHWTQTCLVCSGLSTFGLDGLLPWALHPGLYVAGSAACRELRGSPSRLLKVDTTYPCNSSSGRMPCFIFSIPLVLDM